MEFKFCCERIEIDFQAFAIYLTEKCPYCGAENRMIHAEKGEGHEQDEKE